MDVKKVLIADDNDINRMLLYSLLESYEENEKTILFRIQEVINGLEAVLMAEDNTFDLILMDIDMPGMNGVEATRRIRSFNPNSVIIAVSGVEDTQLHHSIIENGADGYISKPIDPEIFYRFIRRCFAC